MLQIFYNLPFSLRLQYKICHIQNLHARSLCSWLHSHIFFRFFFETFKWQFQNNSIFFDAAFHDNIKAGAWGFVVCTDVYHVCKKVRQPHFSNIVILFMFRTSHACMWWLSIGSCLYVIFVSLILVFVSCTHQLLVLCRSMMRPRQHLSSQLRAAAARLTVACSGTVVCSVGLWLRLPPRNWAATMVVVATATSLWWAARVPSFLFYPLWYHEH
jgi:hypothetical protein